MGLVRNNKDIVRGNALINGLEIVFEEEDNEAQSEGYDKILGIEQNNVANYEKKWYSIEQVLK